MLSIVAVGPMQCGAYLPASAVTIAPDWCHTRHSPALYLHPVFQRRGQWSLSCYPARSLTCRDDLDSKWRLLLAENELSRVSLLSRISIGN